MNKGELQRTNIYIYIHIYNTISLRTKIYNPATTIYQPQPLNITLQLPIGLLYEYVYR